MLYVVVLAIFIIVFIMINILLSIVFNKERSIDKLKYFDDTHEIEEKQVETKIKVSPIKLISNMIPKLKTSKKSTSKLEMDLVRADIPITADEMKTIRLLSSLVLAFLGFAISKNIIVVIVVFIVIWNIPRFIINKKKNDRVTEFNIQLNEGIMIISNSLKAGYSFLQAVAVSSEEMKDPFAKEFKKLLKEMSLGITEEIALKNMLMRMQSDELRLIMNAVLIQKDIGGNLAEILDNISGTLRERQKMRDELRTLMAQGKLSGIIVSMLPVFLGAVIYLLNKEYMIALFTTPLGLGMVGAAILNECIGMFLIRKIANIEM
jgi:tight adherence protein B